MTVGRAHWVLIETGANQGYVFASNRLRHVVGASQLVLQAGTDWVSEAIGKAVIAEVNRLALDRAPGLEVTGVVGPGFDPTLPFTVVPPTEGSDGELPLDHARALRETYRLHARVRAARPPQALRDQVLPWHELCRETGLPAAGRELYGDDPNVARDWHPASASVIARRAARDSAGQRLGEFLGELAVVVPGELDELRHQGWVAVVHADGNGIGRVFLDFPERVARVEGVAELGFDLHARQLAAFGAQLEAVTRQAFRAALEQALADLDAASGPTGFARKATLLPVVVGGDDVTVICHAALALPLVRAFLAEFERRTAADPILSGLAGRDGTGGLTAAAGVAIVKPHHPFSAAYDLAEDLCHSAKQAKTGAPAVPVSSFDVHVAHESTLRDLRDVRDALRIPDDLRMPDAGRGVARHGGPYVLITDDGRLVGAPEHEQVWLRSRDVRHLEELMRALDVDGWLSSAQAHGLRGALDRGLDRGLDEYDALRQVVLSRVTQQRGRDGRASVATADHALLDVVELPPGPPPGRDGTAAVTPGEAGRDGAVRRDRVRFVRLVDALMLQGVGARVTDAATGPEQATGPERATGPAQGDAVGPAHVGGVPEVAR